jgi:chromosome segregation ATPase
MMNAKKSKEFNFNDIGDDEYPDALYQEEIKDLRVEKINQRLTIITILLPCLIGVILFIAYRDLSGRVNRSEFSGSKEVQALSEELEEKFKDIATQFTAVQTSLDEKITPIEKTAADLNEKFKKLNNIDESLKQNLDKSGTTLKTISASKVDKKEPAAAIEKINNSLSLIRKDLEALAPINQDIKSLSTEIQAIDNRFKKDLTSLSETMTQSDNDLIQIRNELANLSDRKLDKASLELEFLKARKIYERTLDETVIKLERRMDSLLKKVKQLERNLRQLEAAATLTITPKTPKTGKIIEQEIKE